MPLNPSFVGHSHISETAYEVSREKITEFADAIGDNCPLSRDIQAARAAGYPDVIAPPTFAMIILLTGLRDTISNPDLGFDYSRMMHREQTYSYRRAVHAGDRLAVTIHIDDMKLRTLTELMTIRAEITDAVAELVVVCNAQIIIRKERQQV